jgi:hypothetical protein
MTEACSIDEINRTLLWLAAVHISEMRQPFICIHSSELLNGFSWDLILENYMKKC